LSGAHALDRRFRRMRTASVGEEQDEIVRHALSLRSGRLSCRALTDGIDSRKKETHGAG